MSLNPDQQKAVDARGHALIVACPGSGKTHTLVARAERIVKDEPHARIGFVTFTNDSAEELKDRLIRKLGPEIMPRVEAGTFHSLCLRQLDTMFPDGKRRIKIADPSDIAKHIDAAVAGVKARFPRIRINREDVSRGIEYAKANNGDIPEDANAEIIHHALDVYTKHLRQQDAFDFSDIIINAVKLMQGGKLKPLPLHYLLVDEFQDADPIQIEWVLLHARAGIKVTCVGDDDQAIYGFRHAKGYDGMMEFAKQTNAEIITLDVTYRCCSQVMSHAAALIGKNVNRVRKVIRTANPKVGSIDRFDFPDVADEMADLALRLARRPAGDSAAVLTRTRAFLSLVEQRLMKEEIPYRLNDNSSFWSAGLPRSIHHLLTVAAGKASGDHRLITRCLSDLGMSFAAIEAAKETIKAGGCTFDALLGKEKWVSNLETPQIELWSNIRAPYIRMAEAAKKGASPEFSEATLQFLKPTQESMGGEKIIDVMRSILARLPDAIPAMYNRVQQMVLESKSKNKDRSDNSLIVLMTLHGSKGLEFDHVWMPGMRQGMLPSGRTTDVTEERRLCYVGMTRARMHLTVSYSQTTKNPESIFLNEMGMPRTSTRVRAA